MTGGLLAYIAFLFAGLFVSGYLYGWAAGYAARGREHISVVKAVNVGAETIEPGDLVVMAPKHEHDWSPWTKMGDPHTFSYDLPWAKIEWDKGNRFMRVCRQPVVDRKTLQVTCPMEFAKELPA